MGQGAFPRKVCSEGPEQPEERAIRHATVGGKVMRLIVKFNIVFLAIFLVGLAIAAYVSLDLLRQNARDEVLQHARIMMESALATRGYTSKQVRPLLETQIKYQFRSEEHTSELQSP